MYARRIESSGKRYVSVFCLMKAAAQFYENKLYSDLKPSTMDPWASLRPATTQRLINVNTEAIEYAKKNCYKVVL